MKFFITLLLVSFNIYANDCDFQIEAYDVHDDKYRTLCLPFTLEYAPWGLMVYNPEGHGGAAKRRPILAIEADGGWFPEKFLIADNLATELEICTMVGKTKISYGNGLVGTRYKDYRMLNFDEKKQDWRIVNPISYYRSIITCK